MILFGVVLVFTAGFFTGWLVRSQTLSAVFEDQMKLLHDLDRENTRLTEAVHAQYMLGREHGRGDPS